MIQTPCILDSHRSLSDGTIKLVFSTQDAKSYGASIAEILSCVGQYGMLGFQLGEDKIDNDLEFPKPDKISPQKLPLGKNKVPPSKALRNAIYVLWEKKGNNGDFDQYYEGIIEYFRKQILTEIDKYSD